MRHSPPLGRLLLQLGVAAAVAAAAAAEPPPSQLKQVTAGGAKTSEAPPASAALATFKGGEVQIADWRAAFAQRLPQEQQALAEPAGRVRLLRDLERYALLIAEAQRRGYAQHVVVKSAVEKAAIEALSASLAVDPADIPDADVAAAYGAKSAQYHRPALRRASQIVVPSEQDASKLLRELRGASREQFGKVARERSIDERTRRQSGELGWFTREGRGPDGHAVEVPPELVAASYALPKVGALAPHPIRVASGFAVLQLTGEDVALEQTLSEAAGEIREQLAAQRSLQRVEELVAELRKRTLIELHPELLDHLAVDATVELDIPQGFPAYPPDPRVGPKHVKPDKY